MVWQHSCVYGSFAHILREDDLMEFVGRLFLCTSMAARRIFPDRQINLYITVGTTPSHFFAFSAKYDLRSSALSRVQRDTTRFRALSNVEWMLAFLPKPMLFRVPVPQRHLYPQPKIL